jgi:hypothetical protein
MNKKSNPEKEAIKKPANAKDKKGQDKPGADPSYNALQQKIDRTRPDRHQGESEMNDENRSGGSRR